MALIAVSTDDPGIARIFFDLRAIDPAQDEQARIASAIEQAFTVAEHQAQQPQREQQPSPAA